jgi:hypothetical protein
VTLTHPGCYGSRIYLIFVKGQRVNLPLWNKVARNPPAHRTSPPVKMLSFELLCGLGFDRWKTRRKRIAQILEPSRRPAGVVGSSTYR